MYMYTTYSACIQSTPGLSGILGNPRIPLGGGGGFTILCTLPTVPCLQSIPGDTWTEEGKVVAKTSSQVIAENNGTCLGVSGHEWQLRQCPFDQRWNVSWDHSSEGSLLWQQLLCELAMLLTAPDVWSHKEGVTIQYLDMYSSSA